MSPFVISESEKLIIEKLKPDGAKGWDHKEFAAIKRRIKNHYRALLSEQCCYCRKNTHGEFNMVLDVEHILPKSHQKFIDFMYELLNLSVSCKRCNLDIKNNDISFLMDINETIKSPFVSSNYRFIHPNLDKYFDHLSYDVTIKNNKKLIKYSPVNSSSKGIYTYNYFQLSKLEIDSINENQGVSESPVMSPTIEEDLAQQIDSIFRENNQNISDEPQSYNLTVDDQSHHKDVTFPHLKIPCLKTFTLNNITQNSLKIDNDQKNASILNLPKLPSPDDKE